MANGSIYKRGDRYYIRYDAGQHPDGRRRQASGGGFKSRNEAQKVLRERLRDVETGTHVAPSPETFAAYARYWLETVIGATIRTHTRRGYEDQVYHHLIPALGRHRLQTIQPYHINAFYRACEAKELSPQSLRHFHHRLRQIFRSAVQDQILIKNVMDQIKAPRIPARGVAVMRAWTGPQLRRVLNELAEDDLYALWHLYAMSGLRCAEAVGLRWQDIDWQLPAIHVRQQIIYSRNAAGDPTLEISKLLKSDHSYRTIELDAETVRLLGDHRKQQLASRLADGPAWKDQDLVFPTGHGRAWLPGKISDRWRRRIRAIKELPYIRLHDLRHTHVSIMLANGANIRMLATRMGHDPAVMLRTYAHMMPNEQRMAVERFVRALTPRSSVETEQK